MYQIIYYYRETIDNQRNIDTKNVSEGIFRLKRNALHYVREIVQNDYKEDDFATEVTKDGINCYKSVKTENGGRKIIELTIKVEKR